MADPSQSARVLAFVVTLLALSGVFGLLQLKAPQLLERAFKLATSKTSRLAATAVILGVFALLVLLNTAYPGFIDHAEPSIASVSWLLLKGQALYHSFDSEARYTLLYGPSTYLTFAGALWFGGSTLSLKVAVLLANVALVLFLWRSYRSLLDGFNAWFMVAVVLLFMFVPRPNHYLFQVRSDVLIITAMAAGLFGATRRSGMLGPIVLGLAAAFVFNAKATGFLYTLPTFAIMLRLRGFWLSAAVAVGAALLAGVPFLLPNISLAQHLAWLRGATGHPSNLRDLSATLRTLPMLLAPPLLLLGPTPWRDPKVMAYLKESRLVLLALSVSFLFAIGASSRIGAGSHHLLPLLPALAYECVRLYQAGGVPFAQRFPRFFRFVCAATAAAALVRAGGGVLEVRDWYTWDQTRAVYQEVHEILERFPNQVVEMGYGDREEQVTFFRPELVFAKNRVSVDEVALADMKMDGIPLPSTTIAALDSCATAVWLIPKGKDPFSLPTSFATLYPEQIERQPLFSDEFRATFKQRYVKRDATSHFDLWHCNQSRSN